MRSHHLILLHSAMVLYACSDVAGWVMDRRLSQLKHRTITSSLSPTNIFMSDSDNVEQGRRPKPQKPRRELTLKELKDEILRNPSAFLQNQAPTKKYKRTRRRVENPKQTYLYASQRLKLQQEKSENEKDKVEKAVVVTEHPDAILARQLGMVSLQQHCDADLNPAMEPRIVGMLRVAEDTDDVQQSEDQEPVRKYLESMAFIIDKPAGWSISSSKGSTPMDLPSQDAKKEEHIPKAASSSPRKTPETSKDEPEYNEVDLIAVMTPQEKAEYEAEVGRIKVRPSRNVDPLDFYDGTDDDDDVNTEDESGASIDDIQVDNEEYSEMDLLAVMTPEERTQYDEEMLASDEHTQNNNGVNLTDGNEKDSLSNDSSLTERQKETTRRISEQTSLNLRKIAARISTAKGRSRKVASFAKPERPSVMSWLRELQAKQDMPIRGSKYWVALAGATDIDDSGLVLLCPKAKVSNIFMDYTDYLVVIGNGGVMAPKTADPIKGTTSMEIISKLKRGRAEDSVTTVKFVVQEKPSTCSSVIQPCQAELGDGVRGDPAANPLERRAPRRLIHCNSMTVSSLLFADEESVQVQTDYWPDDIAVLANRKQHVFSQGSFLGRTTLRAHPATTAYREINGEGDGFPGWTVDRYGKWLLVRHDASQIRGPLPSIHDGNTMGVYYHAGGSSSRSAPVRLLEGKAAPDIIPVLEDGVTYHVSLEAELSTIFLDQRPLRSWLSQHCHTETRVLNCFAGQGGGSLSVAAAVAGASTVSLDLNKKRLDCIPSQLDANGVEFDERHDCIFGDCLDWLARLKKRGEKFDLVILDPPNTFVGKKMKRWNIKDDMEELVALAAPLVKTNGMLWTMTRSSTLPLPKFAKMCQQGLEVANVANSKLDRVQPLPADFPTIGASPVKYLMWRIQK